ncbi:vesicle-associated protein 2-1 isoform X2 [Cajanus cajan]|uniref:vesicle-associated protein 2-1 isoform X2 n=1 Tax=Cajanus cajan TaxID=3821 RepID=UPI00098D84B1|nr:vesicle-associated protein 2-1 isoform X2 [Cajanus cajan]
MTASVANSFITVNPDELRFQFELEKQTYCDLKVLNNTENYVAFKVKTTSPKKYFVRPNTGVIHPWDSCIIRVTLQAQQEYPPNMQCKDKFLLQSTVVAPNTDVDDLPPDTFSKGEKSIEDLKLRVLYISPSSPHGSIEDDPDSDMLKRRRNRKGTPGFSITFAMFVGAIGLLFGLLLKLSLSSPVPPTE